MTGFEAEPPVFAEPWQAQAFALTLELHANGAFTWSEWAAALTEARREHDDDGARYYEHWLSALERLLAARDLVPTRAAAERKDAWAEAYRRTPHGVPVSLT